MTNPTAIDNHFDVMVYYALMLREHHGLDIDTIKSELEVRYLRDRLDGREVQSPASIVKGVSDD